MTAITDRMSDQIRRNDMNDHTLNPVDRCPTVDIEAERERNETANVATTATGLYIRSTIAASYNNAAHIARGGA